MNKIIRYSGSKIKYVSQINRLINYSDKKIYIEPFLGSGAIFLNLTKNFDKYVINDIDRNIVRIFKSFKESSYEDFLQLYQTTIKDFGSLDTKTGYYGFRTWFNTTHWNKDTLEEGIYLSFLANSCINSMMRFGADGFNQGYGMRDFSSSHTKVIHENIREKLEKTEILNCSFFDIQSSSSLMFIDPPYFYRPSYSYVGFNEEEHVKFIDFLNTTSNDVLYTDILHKDIDWKFQYLRQDMKTTSPLKKSESTGNDEVVYYNFKCIPDPLF